MYIGLYRVLGLNQKAFRIKRQLGFMDIRTRNVEHADLIVQIGTGVTTRCLEVYLSLRPTSKPNC